MFAAGALTPLWHSGSAEEKQRLVLHPTESKLELDAYNGKGYVNSWFAHDHHMVNSGALRGGVTVKGGLITTVDFEMNANELVVVDKEESEANRKTIKSNMEEYVLECAKYPLISFHSTSIEAVEMESDEEEAVGEGTHNLRVVGNLHLHGGVEEVVLDMAAQYQSSRAGGVDSVEEAEPGERIVMIGSVRLTPSRWGVVPFRAMLGQLTMKDEVDIYWKVVAVPEEGRA
jgi:polyisoprenoid-binding protein YceI